MKNTEKAADSIIISKSEPSALLELGEVQSRFADIIWEREPVASGELVRICSSELGWKKSTTYTVLRKLCEKGLFTNDDGIVRAKMSRSEYYEVKSRQFVNESFGGSLPAFLAAFTSGRKLSQKETDEILALIRKFEASDAE